MEYLISGPKSYLDSRETGLKADGVNKNQPAGSHLRPSERLFARGSFIIILVASINSSEQLLEQIL